MFPSYVEDILGPCLFDFGYGPVPLVLPVAASLRIWTRPTPAAAAYILEHNRRYQDYDNYVWVRDAKKQHAWWWAPSAASCIRTPWDA